MKLVIVSGLSGSGKSVALRTLEDAGYYCIDNLPLGMLTEVIESMLDTTLRPYDVLFGRGNLTFNHPGNQKLRFTVAQMLDIYNSFI